MVINCDIEFDNNPQGVYFSGQILTGRFTLTVNKVKKMKGKNWKNLIKNKKNKKIYFILFFSFS